MEEYINVLKSLIHKGDRINSGLFSGDMGLCLVLYLLNKDVANHETEEIADALLEKVTESIATMNDTSFCNGLAGIGWAICLMHRKECIQGDINDILYNIDAAVYKSLCNPNISFGTDLANGLIGYMVYILFRLEGSGHNGQEVQALVNEATLRIVIDQLEEKMPTMFPMMSKDMSTSILWDFPILFYCLGKAIKLGMYKEKIEGMLANWSYTLNGAIPFANMNRLALANALAYANRELNNQIICSYIDILFYAVDLRKYLREIDKESFFLNGDWFYAMLNTYLAKALMDERHVRYSELDVAHSVLLEKYHENVVVGLKDISNKEVQSTLLNGYGGALLAYQISQGVFQKETAKSIFNPELKNKEIEV